MKRLLLAISIAGIFCTPSYAQPFPAPKDQKNQKWEYLYYSYQDNFSESYAYRAIITEKSQIKYYSFDEFSKLIGVKSTKTFKTNDALNYFGSLGWELSGVTENTDQKKDTLTTYYFKRPLK